MTDSGILSQVSEGDLELTSVDQVAAADAARRAREREELVDLLSLLAGAAPNLCCNGLDFEAGSCQSGACDCDGPGAEECLGDCAGECANSQTDGLDGGIAVGGGLLNGHDHGAEESQFVHPPMMAEVHPVEPAETKLAEPNPKLAEPNPKVAEPNPKVAELVEALTEQRP
ncbi:MAG: hypothetical protein L6256_10265 [Propionicimonas sp.]|nr:hypothetical protein [Propionicimonas sp.]MCG2805820.1 hypothetical protein [Propionicimonas sp.]